MPDSRYCRRCHADCSNTEPCRCCDSRRLLEHHFLPEDVRNAFDQRFPAVAQAAATDTMASVTRELSLHWLRITDAVLEDEGVSGQIRERVLNAMLYGSTNPAEVVEREQAAQARIDLVQRHAAPVPFRLSGESTT
jgi:hypothetical protein